MKTRHPGLLLMLVSLVWLVTGCASMLSNAVQVATRPPQGQSAADSRQDESQCEEYAKGFAHDSTDHYAACMIGRGHTANASLDHLGWTVAIAHTRPHQAREIYDDLKLCDKRADDAKTADHVSLKPEQEAKLAVGGNLQRPNARRMLVACLGERGYDIRPIVPINEARPAAVR